MLESEVPDRALVAEWLQAAPDGEQREFVAAMLYEAVGEARLDGRGEIIIDKILDDLENYEEYVRPE